jgi:putative endonuclease
MYVVECSDASWYAGVTTDLERRVTEHNGSTKGAKYTKTRRPVQLIYSNKFSDRSAACKAEAAFKKLNRPEKKSYVKKYK